MLIFLFFASGLYAVSIEITAHYGSWSLNLLKSQIEDFLNDALENEIKDRISEDFPGENHVSYQQDLTFDSSGDNMGIALRLYPGGKTGSFSIGVGYYKTKMEFSVVTAIRDELDSGKVFTLSSDGNVSIDSYAIVVDLKWDFFPRSRITPYLSLGGGALKVKGNVGLRAEGSYTEGGVTENYTFDESQKLEEIEDLPSSIPVVILNLGLKAKLMEGFYIYADAGIYNGFLVKGGVSVRF